MIRKVKKLERQSTWLVSWREPTMGARRRSRLRLIKLGQLWAVTMGRPGLLDFWSLGRN